MAYGLTEQWIDGRYARTVLFARYPSHVTPGWLAHVLYPEGAEGVEVMLAQHVRALSPRAAKWLLQFRRVQHASDLQTAADGNRLSDPETEAASAHAEGLARLVQQGLARLFSCSLALTLRCPDLDTLDAATAAVLEAAERLDAQAWPADLEHLQGFHTTLPLGIDALERRQTLDTTALAFSFPLLDDTVSMDHGQLWGVGATRPKPVLLDLRDREHGGPPAPHAILAGPSGSGKTMAFISNALQQLTAGVCDKVIALDPKREGYAGPALHAGGQVLYLNPSTESTLNAFDLPPEVDANGVRIDPVLEQTGYLLGFLRLLLCRQGADLDAEEYGLLEECVVVAYHRAGISSGNPLTWDRPAPVLSDLYDVLGEFSDATAKGLARRLYPYAKGTLARLFSQPTTPGLLDARFVVFDLEQLQEALRPAAAHLIVNHIWREARRVRQRLLVGLDETRTLLDAESSAVLVGDLFAKGRSYGVQVLSMSQSLLDYTRNAQGLRALETTFCTVLFRHEEGQGLRAAQARYHLTDADVTFLLTAPTPRAGEPARAVLCTHRGKKWIRIVPAPLELAWKERTVGDVARLATAPAAPSGEAAG